MLTALTGNLKQGQDVSGTPQVAPRELWRSLGPLMRPYRLQLAATLALAIVSPLLDTVAISLYGRLVDDVLVPRSLEMLGPIAMAYLGLTLIGGVVGFGRSYLSAWVTEHLLFDLRNRLFAHLQTMPLEFFERSRLGDTVSRVTDDVDEVGDYLASSIADGLAAVLKIVFFTGALFLIDARLTLISFVVAPPFWFLSRYLARRVKALSREQRARDGLVTSLVEENLSNAPLVQAYNGQDAAMAGFARETRGVMATQLALERLRAAFSPLIGLVEVGGILIVIGFGAIALAQGQLTLGGLLAFLAYLSQLYSPIRALTRLWSDTMAASASAERVIEVLDRRPVVTSPEQPVTIAGARGALALHDIRYRYPGNELDALRGLSLSLAPGETVALVGRSGAGKSTLTRLLLRFDDPAAGRIVLDEHDLRDLSLDQVRASITVLAQEALFFDVTVREAIAFGHPDATDDEIMAAAKIAGAQDFIQALPEGYNSRVGQRGRALSGGQRQRLSIARAILRNAPILVLDEPTTGLDNQNASEILDAITTLMQGRTTIIISHDLQLIRRARRIVVIDEGRIVEEGDHATLYAARGLYTALYQAAEQHDLQAAVRDDSRSQEQGAA